MTRDEWFGWLQEFLEARMVDAPDETCKTFAENLWQETADFSDDETTIIDAAHDHLMANSAPCPKCGANWGVIGRCAAPDCPSTEARLERFRQAVTKSYS